MNISPAAAPAVHTPTAAAVAAGILLEAEAWNAYKRVTMTTSRRKRSYEFRTVRRDGVYTCRRPCIYIYTSSF